jgi:hypothetical protein
MSIGFDRSETLSSDHSSSSQSSPVTQAHRRAVPAIIAKSPTRVSSVARYGARYGADAVVTEVSGM